MPPEGAGCTFVAIISSSSISMFYFIAFIPPGACLIAVGFVQCHQRGLAVALLTMSVAINSFSRCGWGTNHVDIAPRSVF